MKHSGLPKLLFSLPKLLFILFQAGKVTLDKVSGRDEVVLSKNPEHVRLGPSQLRLFMVVSAVVAFLFPIAPRGQVLGKEVEEFLEILGQLWTVVAFVSGIAKDKGDKDGVDVDAVVLVEVFLKPLFPVGVGVAAVVKEAVQVDPGGMPVGTG